jgi:hypothetical protein
MLDHEKLMELYRVLRDRKVLSVYLDADQRDPAERNKWRTRLEHEVARMARELDGNEAEREDFERAWTLLEGTLDGYKSFLPDRGWVGFATPDRLWYAENVPVPMPDGVYWEEGIRVAPYVRGLKQARPVVVVVVDSRRARVFRYRSGEVAELHDVRADTFMGDINDVGMSKRPASHTGVRGETSTDTAQRVLDNVFERMLKYVLEVVSGVMDPHSFLVIGGTNESSARLYEELPKNLLPRAVQSTPLYLEVGKAELKEIVEQAASQLTQRTQEELLDQVVELAGAGGRACVGREETLEALEEMRVDTLLLSRRLIRAEAELADRCVGQALAQDAAVEELGEQGGERLDQAGGGIGARLRYQIRERGGRRERQTAAGETV